MRTRLTAIISTGAALLLVLGLAARAEEGATKEAVAAAEAWLALVDNGEAAKSWETAAALFKAAVTEEKWSQTITTARRPFGKLLSRQVKVAKYETSLPGAPDGEYVVIQFASVFENKAEAVETVTPMKDPDGEWRVSGYFIK